MAYNVNSMSDDARLGYRHYEFWGTHGDDRSKYAAQQQARGFDGLGFLELAASTNDRVPHRDNDRIARDLFDTPSIDWRRAEDHARAAASLDNSRDARYLHRRQ